MRRRLARGGGIFVVAAALVACGSSRAPAIKHARLGTATLASSSRLSMEPVVSAPKGRPPTRLVTKDLITGAGAVAKASDEVKVNYVSALYTGGRAVDASWRRRHTIAIQLMDGSMISGLVKGIVGERVGGRRELIIPPSLAYGSSGSPPQIPPNSTLIFVIDLLSVSPGSGDD